MKVLDTDMLTLLLQGKPPVVARRAREAEEVVISAVTRIEVLQGRFASLLKAADGADLRRAYMRLETAERDLQPFRIIPITETVAMQFDHLRQVKRLKPIGRGDIVIAAIALAHDATFLSRNVKDFRKVPGLRVENWAD